MAMVDLLWLSSYRARRLGVEEGDGATRCEAILKWFRENGEKARCNAGKSSSLEISARSQGHDEFFFGGG